MKKEKLEDIVKRIKLDIPNLKCDILKIMEINDITDRKGIRNRGYDILFLLGKIYDMEIHVNGNTSKIRNKIESKGRNLIYREASWENKRKDIEEYEKNRKKERK